MGYLEKYDQDIKISADHVLDIMHPERVVERERLEALKKLNDTEVNNTTNNGTVDEIDLDNEKKNENQDKINNNTKEDL